MDIYDDIAFHDGALFTIWGPCTDGSKNPCDCPQCQHADKLETEGKDFNEEYEKAVQSNNRMRIALGEAAKVD